MHTDTCVGCADFYTAEVVNSLICLETSLTEDSSIVRYESAYSKYLESICVLMDAAQM